jgi:hypothetical protein
LNLVLPIHENTAIGTFIGEQNPNVVLTTLLRGLLEGVVAGAVVLRPNQIDQVLMQIDLLKRQGVVDESMENLLKTLRR